MSPPAPPKETISKFKPSDMLRIADEIESLNKDIKGFNETLADKTKELDKLKAIEKKTKWNTHDIASLEKEIKRFKTLISESESELADLINTSEYKKYLIAKEHQEQHGIAPVFTRISEAKLPMNPVPPKSKKPNSSRTVHVKPINGGNRARTRKNKKPRSRK
jgi:septal ring factor EnvC (AmiA/AmiB activator)